MSMIQFSKASTMDPVEGGTYDATLIQLKFVTLKKSGNPGIRFDFTLTEPHVEGKKAFSSKTLDINGLWSTKEWLIKLGADPDDLASDMSLEEFKAKLADWNAQFAGQNVRLVLSTYPDEQTGAPRQSVDQLLTEFEIG